MGEGCYLEHHEQEGCCFITLLARSHTLCQSAPTPAVLRGALPHQPWDGCESCSLTLRAWQVGADSALAPLVTSPGAWSTLLVSGGLCPSLQSKDMNPQRAGASGLSPVSRAKVPLSRCWFSHARHPMCVGPSGHPPCLHGVLTPVGREAMEINRNTDKIAKCEKSSEERDGRWKWKMQSEGRVSGQGGPLRAERAWNLRPRRQRSRAVLGRGTSTAEARS